MLTSLETVPDGTKGLAADSPGGEHSSVTLAALMALTLFSGLTDPGLEQLEQAERRKKGRSGQCCDKFFLKFRQPGKLINLSQIKASKWLNKWLPQAKFFHKGTNIL